MAYSRSAAYGGNGGDAFADNLTEITALVGINIRSDVLLDSIQGGFVTTSGSTVTGTKYGGGGGNPSTIKLDQGDYIVRIDGRAGEKIDQIKFTTARGAQYGPYGGGGGEPFTISGVHVGGFFGRSGALIDQLGVFTQFPS